MSGYRIVPALLVGLFSGFFGGILATRLISARPALAQTPSVLTATELRIVDANGNIRGQFAASNSDCALRLSTVDAAGPHLRILFDANDILDPIGWFWPKDNRAPGYPPAFRTPSINFMDSANRLVANVPWTTAGGAPAVASAQAAVTAGGRGPQSVTSDSLQVLSLQINQLRADLDELKRQLRR